MKPMDSYEYLTMSAEYSIRHAPLPDIAAARALIARARRSAWFRRGFPEVRRIEVGSGGDTYDTGWIRSWTDHAYWSPDRFRISIHPAQLNDVVVLHELAHVIAPQWTGDLERIRSGRDFARRAPDHGAEYLAMLVEVLRRFGPPGLSDDLRDAHAHFGVRACGLDEAMAARQSSSEIEALHRSWTEQVQAESQEHAAAAAAALAGRPVPSVPVALRELPWGWWLLDLRRYGPGRHFGRAALAAHISQVEPCTERDIRAIERSPARPEDLRLHRIALLCAAAIGIDPLRMRTELGLVRWECDLELEDVGRVAPDWAAHVQSMNDLIRARPPYFATSPGMDPVEQEPPAED